MTKRETNGMVFTVAVRAALIAEECKEAARAAVRKDWARAVVFASRAKSNLANLIEDINEIRDREHFERLEREVWK